MILQFMNICRRSVFLLLLTVISCTLCNVTLEKLYTLNRNVSPISYDLYLRTIFDENSSVTGTFTGTVKIEVLILESTNMIELNSVGLKIEKTSMNHIKQLINGQIYTIIPTVVKVDETFLETDNEILKIKPAVQLIKSLIYELTITFSGELKDESLPYGYFMINNGSRPISVTRFHRLHARRGFPCFDLPEMKALFKITLSHKKSYKSLCNLSFISSDAEENDFVKDTYSSKKTKLSTYLLSYAIHDYNAKKQVETENNKLIRIWTSHFMNPDVNHALKYARIFFDYYETYFGVDYPFNKLDILSLKVKPTLQAEESWGLMIGGSRYLSSINNDDDILNILVYAHNIAHYWIGNLVTFKSFNDIWIIEGIATYFEISVATKFAPTGILNEEISCMSRFMNSLDTDESKYFHLPLARPLMKPRENSGSDTVLYDTSYYNKAVTIIRMFEIVLGKLEFDNALSQTIKQLQNESVTPETFWNTFDRHLIMNNVKTEAVNFAQVARTWAENAGYPVITVKNDVAYGVIVVSQETSRYPYAKDKNTPKNVWMIPLSYTASYEEAESPLVKDWLLSDRDLQIKDIADWVIFNVNSGGYYRVNYDTKNWLKIAEVLKTKDSRNRISATTRARLLNDVWYFAYENKISYDIVFEIMESLKLESEYIVWWAALEPLEKLLPFVNVETPSPNSDFSDKIAKILKPHFLPLYTKYKNEILKCPTEFAELHLKVLIIKWGCWANVDNCRAQVKLDYQNALAKCRSGKLNTTINEDILIALLSVVAENGDLASWSQVLTDVCLESDLETKMPALARTRQAEQVERYLNRYNYGGLNNMSKALENLLKNPYGYKKALSYVQNNLKETIVPSIRNKYKTSETKLNEEIHKLFDVMSKYIREETEMKELKVLVKSKFPTLDLDEENVIRIKKNIDWVKDVRGELHKVITAWYSKTP